MKTKEIIIGRRGFIGLRGFWGLMVLISLAGCSSESVVVPEVPQKPQVEYELPMELSTSVPTFDEFVPASRGITRAFIWDPPSGFHLYEELFGSGVHYTNLATSPIDAFFARKTDDPATLEVDESITPLHGRLGYSSSNDLWSFISLGDKPKTTGDYFAYGFIPSDAANGTHSIDLLPSASTFKDGAVLHINGMQTVGKDVCVIVGAKEGFRVETSAGNGTDYDGGWDDEAGGTEDKYDDGTDTRTNRVHPGDFEFNLQVKDVSEGVPYVNHLFLLFEHLCSSLGISMQVDPTYNDLRTIKVTELQMQTFTDASPTTPNTKRTNVTIKLTANDENLIPFGMDDVTYTPDPSSGYDENGTTFFKDAAGVELSITPVTFMGNFVPLGVTKLSLTSTFDVYDKKGNLVRKGSKATNTIQLKSTGAVLGIYGNMFSGCERGKKYLLNLTINPTYLYMMSDPDLENPTMVVN